MDHDQCSQKIFGEVLYSQNYEAVHEEMVTLIRRQFSNVESGIQSDSWIWIIDGDEKVVIDTFYSEKHQIKSKSSGSLVRRVIDALRADYVVQVLDTPVEEWG